MKRTLIMFALLVLAVFSLGANCGVRPQPMPVEPKDTAMCSAACDHLYMLGCKTAEPLKDGTSCTDFCIKTQKSGHALRPSCIVTIKTCEELNSVCQKLPRDPLE